jgi:hypothetical protein
VTNELRRRRHGGLILAGGDGREQAGAMRGAAAASMVARPAVGALATAVARAASG